jgi:hypothetical protein
MYLKPKIILLIYRPHDFGPDAFKVLVECGKAY